MKLFFTDEFGKAFVPRKARPYLHRYLFKAGIYHDPYNFFGILFYISYLLTIILYFRYFWEPIKTQALHMVFVYAFLIWLILPLALVGFFTLFVYFYIDIRIFNRTRKMEEVLPDFLATVSSNLKGGLSFENALWLSIKPRFGVLAHEIALAAKKVMTGNDVDEALQDFASKYDSPMLKRTVDLIVGEIASGGKIADIMDDIVHSLKKTKALKDEMNAAVISYMIFIAAIVIFIAPLLFALSFNLLSVIQGVTSMLSSSTAGASGFSSFLGSASGKKLDPQLFINFSRWAVAIIAFFSSMIVAILEKGNVKAGVKYIPIFLISSQVMYTIFMAVFGFVFGNFIKI
ncbi:type II secretion system F family protein [Candidatus Woesearchaeota archaeon]|nr:type II secretion system F family protein [Candidatus Woesearchaeota archaeon]